MNTKRGKNIKLSFRQLNDFKFYSVTKEITSNFFSQKFLLKIPDSCSLEKDIEFGDQKQAQAEFKCSIKQLNILHLN